MISPLTAVQSSFTELVVTVDIVGVPGVPGSEMNHQRFTIQTTLAAVQHSQGRAEV